MAVTAKTSTSTSKNTAASNVSRKTADSTPPAANSRKAATPATPSTRKKSINTEPAKPARVQATAKPVTPRKKSVKPASSPQMEQVPNLRAITQEHRYQMIATAAYFLAEKRGFASGHEIQDWVAAESQINAQLLSLA